jgi:hypothetical protein
LAPSWPAPRASAAETRRWGFAKAPASKAHAGAGALGALIERDATSFVDDWRKLKE